MAEILFINDEYYNRVISSKRTFDKQQIISSIRLVQNTNLMSILTKPVYDYFVDKLSGAEVLNEEEDLLFKDLQLYLAVKTAEEMIYAAPRKQDEKDGSHLVYRGKATLLESRMVKHITRSEVLLALAQSGNDEFDESEMDVQGGFYFG